MAGKRRIANTEDRIESHAPLCGYNQCQARLSARAVADGHSFCDDECWYASLMMEYNDDSEEEDDDEDDDEE